MLKNKNKKTLKDPDYFIVGLQKSGTFWLTALLDVHPEIRCLPSHYMHSINKGATGADEGRIFDMLATMEADGGATLKNSFTNHHGGFFKAIVPLVGGVSRKKLEQAVRERYREWFVFHNPERKPIVGDKTTEYIFHLDAIDGWYPNAKKICILRDPKDRIVSWHYHQIRRGRKKTWRISDRFIRDYLEDRVRKEYEHMLAYEGEIFCLTYEALSAEPEKTLTKLLRYLGTSTAKDIVRRMIDSASLEALRERDALVSGGHGKKAGVTVVMSHYRKGIAGDWKNHLTAEQVRLIDSLTGEFHKKVCRRYGVASTMP